MTKAILILGMIGVTGAVPLCDICGPRVEVKAMAASEHSAASDYASVARAADTVTLHVEGMTCAGCVIGVRKVLTKLEGVSKAEVSYETKRAVVTFDKSKVTVDQMIAAIKTLGYTATVVTT